MGNFLYTFSYRRPASSTVESVLSKPTFGVWSLAPSRADVVRVVSGLRAIRPTVLLDAAAGGALVRTPWLCEYWPRKLVARDGQQFVTKEFSKISTPGLRTFRQGTGSPEGPRPDCCRIVTRRPFSGR